MEEQVDKIINLISEEKEGDAISLFEEHYSSILRDAFAKAILRRDNFTVFEWLVKKGIHVLYEGDTTLLHISSCLGKRDYIEYLLKAGANVDHMLKDNVTPLMSAASYGYREIVEMLLDYGANINAQSENGKTALTFAAYNVNFDIAQLLVERGAKIDEKIKDCDSILIAPAASGHLDFVKLLVESGANVNAANDRGNTPLICAVFRGNIALGHDDDDDDDDDHHHSTPHADTNEVTPGQHLDVINLLLDHGADVNATNSFGNTALMAGADLGYVDVVDILLAHGANVDAVDNEGDTALMLAINRGNDDIVKKLLTKRPNLEAKNKSGNTALLIAVNLGKHDIVDLLLDHGADVESKDIEGNPALILASYQGHLDVVKALLLRRANLEARTNIGGTVLMMAAQNGHLEVVKLLIESGVKLEAKSKLDRSTALYYSVLKCHTEVVKELVKAGADVNVINGNSNTPLHLAILYNNVDIVKVLLEAKADIYIKTEAYPSPATLALGFNGKIIQFHETSLKILGWLLTHSDVEPQDFFNYIKSYNRTKKIGDEMQQKFLEQITNIESISASNLRKFVAFTPTGNIRPDTLASLKGKLAHLFVKVQIKENESEIIDLYDAVYKNDYSISNCLKLAYTLLEFVNSAHLPLAQDIEESIIFASSYYKFDPKGALEISLKQQLQAIHVQIARFKKAKSHNFESIELKKLHDFLASSEYGNIHQKSFLESYEKLSKEKDDFISILEMKLSEYNFALDKLSEALEMQRSGSGGLDIESFSDSLSRLVDDVSALNKSAKKFTISSPSLEKISARCDVLKKDYDDFLRAGILSGSEEETKISAGADSPEKASSPTKDLSALEWDGKYSLDNLLLFEKVAQAKSKFFDKIKKQIAKNKSLKVEDDDYYIKFKHALEVLDTSGAIEGYRENDPKIKDLIKILSKTPINQIIKRFIASAIQQEQSLSDKAAEDFVPFFIRIEEYANEKEERETVATRATKGTTGAVVNFGQEENEVIHKLLMQNELNKQALEQLRNEAEMYHVMPEFERLFNPRCKQIALSDINTLLARFGYPIDKTKNGTVVGKQLGTHRPHKDGDFADKGYAKKAREFLLSKKLEGLKLDAAGDCDDRGLDDISLDDINTAIIHEPEQGLFNTGGAGAHAGAGTSEFGREVVGYVRGLSDDEA